MKDAENFASAAAEDLDAVAHVLVELAPVVLRLARERKTEIRTELLHQFLGGAVAPTPVDIEEARLRAEAVRRVLAGAKWVPAADLAAIANVTVQAVMGWKGRGRIFSIQFEGKDWYPLYAIDDTNRPIRELAEVIRLLMHEAGWSSMGLAVWFESTSAFLKGGRPRESLARNAPSVVAAAKDLVGYERNA
ncbi:MAG TPA: hypothetical protein VHA82_11100 [Ramlibacter sp.]|uniref:hypothetical protein n=1 Tax=Ramlibacter sp. TaxID=1917967 RepID=UPI002B582AC9|nr:hypothetical protein [Ramlibacter sp.]HVZ44347.1 hypothetical protein [Ramlibacter sp.]